MRIFTVYGISMYAGEYNIYEGETEFNKLMPGVPVKIWAKDWDIQTGDYVRADDGYIVKCLKRSEMKTPGSGICLLFKFPQGTFYHRRYNNGGEKIARFYAQFTVAHKNSVNGGQSTRREKTKGSFNRERFAAMLIAGVSPYEAFKMTYDKMPVSNTIVKKKILELYMSEEVQTALREKYSPFLDKLQTDPEFSDEMMVKYIKNFMVHVKQGSLVHLQSIIPLLRLMGKLPEEEIPGKKLTKANGIPYEEIPPPQNRTII